MSTPDPDCATCGGRGSYTAGGLTVECLCTRADCTRADCPRCPEGDVCGECWCPRCPTTDPAPGPSAEDAARLRGWRDVRDSLALDAET